ncbi:hypothetical protein Tco_0893210 [Tanacetum coccineum]|uniref:Retroviral polymerase SH3-like domain-containing protein n=1 Tax=Tanacetum coccineum TaxID=301880 RepID=A0ABQ5C9H1_9ASTR
MPANQEHVHLAWPLWSDLRVIPTHGEFCSLVRPLAIFARSCLVDLIRMTTLVRNNSVFRSFFEKQKLIGPNFIDWYKQLWLVLSTEDKEKYLEQPIPATPVAAAPDQPIPPAALDTYKSGSRTKRKLLTGTSTDCERFSHVQAGGRSIVSSYFLKMKSYIDQLECLSHPVTLNLGVQKNKNRKPSKAAKGVQGKGKGKKAYANAEPFYAPKLKIPPPPKKDNPAKDAISHHCGEVGHWRRNYPTYLPELLKKKQLSQGASTSGYPKETMGYSFYNPSKNKVFVARNAEFFESNLIDQEASESLEDLKIIQEEDTNPSLDTSLNHEEDDQEIYEPQSDINPIRRSSRTKRAPDRMCLYIDAEEHELGDLGEPANYKAALLDPKSEK